MLLLQLTDFQSKIKLEYVHVMHYRNRIKHIPKSFLILFIISRILIVIIQYGETDCIVVVVSSKKFQY